MKVAVAVGLIFCLVMTVVNGATYPPVLPIIKECRSGRKMVQCPVKYENVFIQLLKRGESIYLPLPHDPGFTRGSSDCMKCGPCGSEGMPCVQLFSPCPTV